MWYEVIMFDGEKPYMRLITDDLEEARRWRADNEKMYGLSSEIHLHEHTEDEK